MNANKIVSHEKKHDCLKNYCASSILDGDCQNISSRQLWNKGICFPCASPEEVTEPLACTRNAASKAFFRTTRRSRKLCEGRELLDMILSRLVLDFIVLAAGS
ncbi:hypothetical protein AAC387_Pa09g1052 [Persea americana]